MINSKISTKIKHITINQLIFFIKSMILIRMEVQISQSGLIQEKILLIKVIIKQINYDLFQRIFTHFFSSKMPNIFITFLSNFRKQMFECLYIYTYIRQINSKFITLRNSQISMFSIIDRAFETSICSIHSLPLTHFTPNNSITCIQCLKAQLGIIKKQDVQNYSLQLIFKYPITLMFHETSQQMSKLVIHTLSNIHSFKTNNYTILSNYLDQLKSTVSTLCENILKEYNKAPEQYLTTLEQIQNISSQYYQQLEMMMSQKFINRTPQQLQLILKEYKQTNHTPTRSIKSKLQHIHSNIQLQSSIQWSRLKQIYQKVTDPSLWKISEIYTTFRDYQNQQKSLFIFKDQIGKLLLPNRYLSYNSESKSLTLLCQSNKVEDSLLEEQQKLQQNQNYSQISQISLKQFQQIDSFYEINQYHVLAISYSNIHLLKYSFDQLIIIKQFQISGCIAVLPYNECVILLAKNKIIKIWINSLSSQVIGLQYENIRKSCSNFAFEAQDSFGKWDKFDIYRNNMIDRQ